MLTDQTRWSLGHGKPVVPSRWQATLRIGRGKVAGQAAQFWPGSVDDVRVYTGALDKDRIGDLYGSYPAQS